MKNTLYFSIEKIAKIDHSSIVYVDEAGVDNRLYREYGMAPKGEKIYADILGKKCERIRLPFALSTDLFTRSESN